MTNKEIKEYFRELLTSGNKSRSNYLARAFLLSIPYHILEKKSHDQVCLFSITLAVYQLSKINSNKLDNKIIGEKQYEIKQWIQRSIDSNETALGRGWHPYNWATISPDKPCIISVCERTPGDHQAVA